MGMYFREASLEPEEHVLFSATAKRIWAWRSVAGRLLVTDQRVMYLPTWLDTLVGARTWSVAVEDIDNVSLQDRGLLGARRKGPAGWRATIIIDGANESSQFAVKDIHGLEAAISSARKAP